MSILIKDMEMPKSCWDCFACHDGWCIINQKIEGHRTVTHSCPLVEVPKHGDLIDRDAINWEDEIWKKKCISPYVVYRTWVLAKELPTIIESEE